MRRELRERSLGSTMGEQKAWGLRGLRTAGSKVAKGQGATLGRAGRRDRKVNNCSVRAEPRGERGERSLRAPGKPRAPGRRPSPETQLSARGEEGARQAHPEGREGKSEAGLETAETRGSGQKCGLLGRPSPNCCPVPRERGRLGGPGREQALERATAGRSLQERWVAAAGREERTPARGKH